MTYRYGGDKTREFVFQNDIIQQMLDRGWQLGESAGYHRELAMYPEDLLGFVKETQAREWEKYVKLYPNDPDGAFLKRVASQLGKADPHAGNRMMRTHGMPGVLRHDLKDRGARFSLCQFKPDHGLNPEANERFAKNRFRLVPELVYSPWVGAGGDSGSGARKWRLDLVLFVNGLPVVTMELKSEFKQDVQNAVRQYKTTRLPKDPQTGKPEPLLTFKRGALVHFAVSQYQVYMTTRLNGSNSVFLPFNKGTANGGAGNDVPSDPAQYATSYLWNEVLLPHNLLNILARFVHLKIEEKEEANGKRYKKESLIFPRYHQWDVVNQLVNAARVEGPGHKYLIQHSAGSGKSNSIAWTAHQLASLRDEEGQKRFHSVIVVTDRTVLDNQLQDTIYQFEHTEGVVGRINRGEGEGSKSVKLAAYLQESKPIIIVTIQTFPHVMKAIESNVSLSKNCYAIIADEAHSSQTGATAQKLREALMVEKPEEGEELSSDDLLNATLSARPQSPNLSYFAFTATPKPKTLEIFGRPPKPEESLSESNIPKAFHVYTMRQAIEEGFILDVLKNYTNYKVAYNLALSIQNEDPQVDARRARVKLNQWVKLHDYNISQKVQIIVEHFKDNVMGLLNGQARAMVVTGSRKEVVRYKFGFDKYVADKGYHHIKALVAFSGEVSFEDGDPGVEGLLGEKFTESNMNPGLKGRDLAQAFDREDYQVMLVANKYQTGFDQPKLCAMYVDKKLAGVECVQTLSRLNRIYPGKEETGTFVLDFFNDWQDIVDAFQDYYGTTDLIDVTDPNLIFDLYEKLNDSGIYKWSEVERFCEAWLRKSASNGTIANICKPAVERWVVRYRDVLQGLKESKDEVDRARKTQDDVLIGNAETRFSDFKKARDRLDIFKKDLGSYVRYYEYMSQIVDYNDKGLEMLSLYARTLRPLLRESQVDEPEIQLDHLALTHYRISTQGRRHLKLDPGVGGKLKPGDATGTAVARDRKEALLSKIIERLNQIFDTDGLTDADMIHYTYTIRDKIRENERVMAQIANNDMDQALLGDFPKAMNDAIMDSSQAHQNQMMQLFSSTAKKELFAKLVMELLKDAG